MSKSQRFPEEFKIEAVKQVTERHHDVAQRLGIFTFSLFQWVKLYSTPESERQQASDPQAEIRRFKAELPRVTDVRDILKKAAAYFIRQPEYGYRKIKDDLRDQGEALVNIA